MIKNSKKRTQKIKIMPSVGSPDTKASLKMMRPIILEQVDLRNSHQSNNDDAQVHPDPSRNNIAS